MNSNTSQEWIRPTGRRQLGRFILGAIAPLFSNAALAQTVDLSLTATPPASPCPGTAGGFIFTIGGLAGASGVTLTAVFQPPVTYGGVSGGGTPTCSANSGSDSTTVMCHPVTASPVTLTITPISSGTLNMVAGVIADQPDSNMSNNSSVPAALTLGGPAPGGLAAIQVNQTQITVTWTAPTGGADSYEVSRAQTVGGAYTVLSPNPTSPSFADTSAALGGTYLYRVRASKLGCWSGYSNVDPATRFSDYPIVRYATVVRADHINELRAAIDIRRAIASLSPGAWTPAIAVGDVIRRGEMQQLRDLLDQAMGAGSYTDQPLTAFLPGTLLIKKQHVDELRSRVQ